MWSKELVITSIGVHFQTREKKKARSMGILGLGNLLCKLRLLGDKSQSPPYGDIIQPLRECKRSQFCWALVYWKLISLECEELCWKSFTRKQFESCSLSSIISLECIKLEKPLVIDKRTVKIHCNEACNEMQL